MKKSCLFAAAAVLLSLAACQKSAPAPEGAVSVAEGVTVPFYGGEVAYTLESNCDWEISETTVDVVPVKGTSGTTTLTVTVPANTGSEALSESFTVTFKNADGLTTRSTVEITVPAPSLSYGGVDYKVVYLADGNYWMAENLRYIPEGMTPSTDPADGSGLWYSYEVVDGAGVALTDDASVAALGLLYSAPVVFGVDEINADNYKTLEAAQGICPDGWHIPTRAELRALCGAGNKADDEESAPEEDPNSVFWNAEAGYATIGNANAAGFNFQFAGYVFNNRYMPTLISESNCDNSEWHGSNAMNYIHGSTGYTSDSATYPYQLFALMTTFTGTYKEGRITATYNGRPNASGMSVRCVMD